METQVGDCADHELHTANSTIKTESLFHTYSQYASVTSIEPTPSEDEQQTEDKLNEILEKVSSLPSFKIHSVPH